MYSRLIDPSQENPFNLGGDGRLGDDDVQADEQKEMVKAIKLLMVFGSISA